MLQPWAAQIARTFNIPAVVLWVQPAIVFDIYFYGYGDSIKKITNDPSSHVELPHLPNLTSQDLPYFMMPSSPNLVDELSLFREQLEALGIEENPKILVNTFDELECKALRAIKKHNLIAIGPLVPSKFLDEKDSSDNAFGADLFQNPKDICVEWLDSKPKKCVVYISFGSLLTLPERQAEEIARGLLKSHQPFLWVVKVKENGKETSNKTATHNFLQKFYADFSVFEEELRNQGLIVPWCSQMEVLSHPSLGCFVTHCGWNSTLESLVSGVPVVGLPYNSDQPTNAKLLQDEFKIGVRAKPNDQGVVEGDEINRCIDLVLGCDEAGEVMRENAKKWKCLAKEATKEGGSSYKNLKAFVDEIE